jgi:8-oxo-dGTP diphosphatase
MPQKRAIIAAAILRQGDKILLVHQQGPDDPTATWALPGGAVEEGELLTEALAREVREETGLEVVRVGPLAYAAQTDAPRENRHGLAFVFEVAEWRGVLRAADPDELILGAEFCSRGDALRRLRALPWPEMRDPILAYLRGEAGRGSVWLYRQPG